jgi:hypothetical protein
VYKWKYHKWTVWGLSCLFARVYIHLGRAQTMVCAHNQQNLISNKRTLLPTIKWCHE